MSLGYLLLPVGTVLLAVPTSVVCGAKIRARLNQPARRRSEGPLPLVRCWINWADLLRGAAGVWLVQRAFQDTLSSQDELAPTLLAVQLSILLVGVLAQTLLLRRPVRVIGPVFFLAGVTLALSGPLTGGFALAFGLACALMMGRLSLVFYVMPVALVAFGIIFREFGAMTAFNAAVFSLPAFLGFTFGTRISFLRRPAEIRGWRAHAAPARASAGKTGPVVLKVPEAVGLKVPEPVGLKVPEPVPLKVPEPHPVRQTEMPPARRAAPVPLRKPEVAPNLGTVIFPDFVHPPVPAPTKITVPGRRVAGDPAALPDFLRIAEDPEAPRRRVRKRLFDKRGA
jgi:hypothetical protein